MYTVPLNGTGTHIYIHACMHAHTHTHTHRHTHVCMPALMNTHTHRCPVTSPGALVSGRRLSSSLTMRQKEIDGWLL